MGIGAFAAARKKAKKPTAHVRENHSERPQMTELWTPSMFQKLFELVAKSDKGMLGAMSGRQRSVSMGEFLSFMKANSYKTLGLTLSDLTDAFKFANSATSGTAESAQLLDVQDDSGGPRLRRGAFEDKSEMSEEEFWQCLMFVQARYNALKSETYLPVLPTRAAFDYNNGGLQQLGRFMLELCGKAICVRLGDKQQEMTLRLGKNVGKSEGESGQQASMSRRKKCAAGGGEKRVDENAPLTDIEKKRV